MSVVWARDGNSEWGCGESPFGNDFSKSSITNRQRMISPMDNCDKEGYSGTPRSFIDVNDPRVEKYSREYNKRGRAEFLKNKELVKSLINQGVLYPTGKMIEEIVNRLRKIAGK